MTTPMHVYAQIAARYAIDISDDTAVDEFFLKIVPTLPESERKAIFEELLAGSGVPNISKAHLPEAPDVIPLLPLDGVAARHSNAATVQQPHGNIATDRPLSTRRTHIRGRTDRDQQFEPVYRSYFRRVVRYFVSAFRVSQEDAEDLTNDVFLRFLDAMDDYRGDAEWAFLETIALRVGLNRIRAWKAQKRSAKLVPIDDPDSGQEPAAPQEPDYAERKEAQSQRERMYAEIALLPSRQRQCIHLWLDDYKYDAIARTLRISVDAVKSAIRDAKRQLRARLGDPNALPEDES